MASQRSVRNTQQPLPPVSVGQFRASHAVCLGTGPAAVAVTATPTCTAAAAVTATPTCTAAAAVTAVIESSLKNNVCDSDEEM